MSSSAQLTSEQLKEDIDDENNTGIGAREVLEEVEDDGKDCNPAYTNSKLNTVISKINNEFEHMSVDKIISLLNLNRICHLPDDQVQGHKNSIPGRPGTMILAHQVPTIWSIVRRCVWDADMPEVLVEEEMGLRKTFASVALEMMCKLLSERSVMGLPITILW
jgi:hypothetical protein